jgi:hypothetical protein
VWTHRVGGRLCWRNDLYTLATFRNSSRGRGRDCPVCRCAERNWVSDIAAGTGGFREIDAQTLELHHPSCWYGLFAGMRLPQMN